jgi:hypothetical protein
MTGGDRFPSNASVFLHDASGKHPLVPDFAASADPALSFDGQAVLFAGKRSKQAPWQIWETPLTGGGKRRLPGRGKIATPDLWPRKLFAEPTFCVTVAFCSRPDIRSGLKLHLRSIRSIPTAAASNPTAATTALPIIKAGRSTRAT